MTSVRESFGLECPKCGHDDQIQIWAYAMVAMTPTGSIETNDPFHEWAPDHYCACRLCDYEATVADFTVETIDAQDCQP